MQAEASRSSITIPPKALEQVHLIALYANHYNCSGYDIVLLHYCCDAAGFTDILEEVLEGRVSNQPSNLTVGDINHILDSLAR